MKPLQDQATFSFSVPSMVVVIPKDLAHLNCSVKHTALAALYWTTLVQFEDVAVQMPDVSSEMTHLHEANINTCEDGHGDRVSAEVIGLSPFFLKLKKSRFHAKVAFNMASNRRVKKGPSKRNNSTSKGLSKRNSTAVLRASKALHIHSRSSNTFRNPVTISLLDGESNDDFEGDDLIGNDPK